MVTGCCIGCPRYALVQAEALFRDQPCHLYSNLRGDEAENLTSRRGLSAETPSLSLQPATSSMTKRRTNRSFTATGSARWLSSQALVCQLPFRISHCYRSAPMIRNHAHNLLPKPLVESQYFSPQKLPFPGLTRREPPKITRMEGNKDYGHSSELKIRWVFTFPPL